MSESIWFQKPDVRMAIWRELRQQLDTLSLGDALKETSNLWSFAPYVDHYLDSHDVSQWPSPWELLTENYYCDLAKTLGMLYTIALSKHNVNQLELRVLYDEHKKERVNIVVVNNKHVINYHFNEVVNTTVIGAHCVTKHCYTPTDLNIEQYY